MTLDYFYGQAGELFSFYLIPKALFQETTVPEPVNRCQDPVRYPAGPHEPVREKRLAGRAEPEEYFSQSLEIDLLLRLCPDDEDTIKEVRVGRDYDIEIILNVPLDEFEEFKSHSLSVRTPSRQKTDLKQAPVRGLGTPNGGIVVFDKTSGEAMNIMPKSSAHVTLRCQDE